MPNYIVSSGESIDSAARGMCSLARESGSTVIAEFNDIDLVATPDMSPSDIEKMYFVRFNARREQYLATPEGQASERRIQEHAAPMIAADNALLRRQRDELLEAAGEIIVELRQGCCGGLGVTIGAINRLDAAISSCTPSPALDSGAGQTSGPAPEGCIPVPDDESLVSERLNENANGYAI